MLVSKAKPDDKYPLVVGILAYEKDLYVQLVYLSNRTDSRRCLRIPAKAGDRIRLTHAASRQAQNYTVTKVTEDSVTVVRSDKDLPAKEYKVQPWRREDFIESEQGRTEPAPEGAPGPEGGAMPGMAPGMRPGGRGGRR